MSYQRVLDAIGRAEGIEKLFEGVKDPRGVESARAKATLRELAYNYGVRNGMINPAVVPTAIEVREEDAEKYAKGAQARDQGDASNLFSSGYVDIIGRDIPVDSLREMTKYKEISDKASSKEDKELIKRYSAVGFFDGLIRKCRNNDSLSEGEEKAVAEASIKGAEVHGRQKEATRQQGLGYSDVRLQELTGQLYAISVQRGYLTEGEIDRFVLIGLGEEKTEAEAEYNVTAGRLGRNVEDAVRASLTRLTTGSAKEFETALSIVYKER